MTTTPPSTPPAGPLGELVATRISGLQHRYLARESGALAALAALRGASTSPGADPRTWELTVAGVSPGASGDEPTRREVAAHAAMTLYAVHQQARSDRMHRAGHGLGAAVRVLGGQRAAEGAVRARFDALSTATGVPELLHHARGLVRQLRGGGIPLDYGRLAEDLLDWQDPARVAAVRLRWGRDYHRSPLREHQADTPPTDAPPTGTPSTGTPSTTTEESA